MNAHTPTPYVIDYSAKRARIRIASRAGTPVATVECASANTELAKATADFITNACNAHDELVAAAVRVLSKRFILGVSETGDLGRLADAVAKAGGKWMPQQTADACEIASAALAKAGAA